MSSTQSLRHLVGVIERHAVADAAAAIVADDGELVEAETLHHLDLVERHRALRVVDVVLAVGRLAALAVAAQVGHDHRVVLRQVRREQPHRDVRLRRAVHQQQRRSRSGVHEIDLGAGCLDARRLEAGKEPQRAARPRRGLRHHRPAERRQDRRRRASPSISRLSWFSQRSSVAAVAPEARRWMGRILRPKGKNRPRRAYNQRVADLRTGSMPTALVHLDELFRVARRVMGDAAAAEDVVQDTYLRSLAGVRPLRARHQLPRVAVQDPVSHHRQPSPRAAARARDVRRSAVRRIAVPLVHARPTRSRPTRFRRRLPNCRSPLPR